MESGLDNRRNFFRRPAGGPAEQIASASAASPEITPPPEAQNVPNKFVVLLPGDVPESPMGGRYAVDDTIDAATTPGAFVRNGYKLRLLTEEDRPHFKVENAIQIAELDASPPGPGSLPRPGPLPGPLAGPAAGLPVGSPTGPQETGTAAAGAGTNAQPDTGPGMSRVGGNVAGRMQQNRGGADQDIRRVLNDRLASARPGGSDIPSEVNREPNDEVAAPRRRIMDRLRGTRVNTTIPSEVNRGGGAGGGGGGGNEGARAGAGGRQDRPRVPQPGDVMDGQGQKPREVFALDPSKFKESDYTGIKLKTLQAIQASEFDQQYFGMMLQKRGASPDLAERWKNNQTTAEDRNYLTYAAYEYSKWIQIAQETGNKIATPDTLALLAKHHPEMRNLVTSLEEPGAINRAKGIAIRLAMEDPASMKDLADTVYDLDETRKTFSYKRWDKKIEGQRNRLGLTRAEYGKMMDLGDRANRGETVDRLQKHIHDRAGAARRVLDSIEKGMLLPLTLPLSSRAKALREVERAISITPQWGGPSNIPIIGGFLTRMGAGNRAANMRTNMLDRLNNDLKTIAGHMGDTLEKNPDIINAVMQEALENRPITPESERGPRTFTAMQKESADEVTLIQNRLNRVVQAYPDWNDRSRDQQRQILEQMRPSIEQEIETTGMGFFAWLTRILFKKNWNAAVNQVFAQPRAAAA